MLSLVASCKKEVLDPDKDDDNGEDKEDEDKLEGEEEDNSTIPPRKLGPIPNTLKQLLKSPLLARRKQLLPKLFHSPH